MRPRGLLLAAPLLVAILAGCSSTSDTSSTSTTAATGPDLSHLSQAIYAVKAPVEEWVASASDGARLDNAVYLPDVPAGVKVPVFINFSPYWGDSAMDRGDNFAHYMVREYVPRGYAVVLSAVRGTGHSEGCFQIGGDLELKDAYDVIDHFAKASWSTGAVAAGGKSYDSTTQNGVIAKFPHPALKGIFHVSGITDMYRYNAKSGVVYNNGLLFNTRYGLGQGIDEYGLPGGVLGSGANGTSNGDEDQESLARLAGDAACPEMPKQSASGLGTAAHGMRDAYWQERDWVSFLPHSSWNGTVFFVHGLQDWNVKPDDIDPWVDILQEKGIAVKGWLHQETDNAGHLYPMRQDWNLTMLRWLDWTLKGVDSGFQDELGFDVQGSDKVWRHSDAWPPAPTGSMTFDPARMGGNPTSKESPEVGHRFAGVPYAHVTVTSTSPDPIVHLVLYDVGPDGTQEFLNEAVARLALNDALTGPRPWVAGSTVTANLTFYPMDHEFLPGHHLALDYGLDPTQQETPTPADFEYTPTQASGTTYTSIQVTLPEVAMAGQLEPQPLHMKCFAC